MELPQSSPCLKPCQTQKPISQTHQLSINASTTIILSEWQEQQDRILDMHYLNVHTQKPIQRHTIQECIEQLAQKRKIAISRSAKCINSKKVWILLLYSNQIYATVRESATAKHLLTRSSPHLKRLCILAEDPFLVKNLVCHSRELWAKKFKKAGTKNRNSKGYCGQRWYLRFYKPNERERASKKRSCRYIEKSISSTLATYLYVSLYD